MVLTARCQDAFAVLYPRGALVLARAACATLCVTLAACGGDGRVAGASAPDGNSRRAQAKVSLEPAGANCAQGGSRIEGGIDANGNGTLDANEVTSVQYACNGAPGADGSNGANGSNGADGGAGAASLVRIDAEPAGANCAGGGTRIRAGLDANGNSLLDTGEVSSTRYLCAGTNGADGANGANGTSGANGTDGSNGANGSNGSDGLIAIANEAAGTNCAHGGKRVSTGLDANANQVLDAGEVSGTSYLCTAAPGASLGWTHITGTTAAMAANNGYLANNAALVTLTLPASPTIGDIVAVNGVGFGGWRIAQNVGQFITARSAPHDRDAGAVWTAAGPTQDWQAIASSANGNKLVAAPWPGQIYTSTDAGATWMARESSRFWGGVASSAVGQKLVAVAYGGNIHTSTDGGANWTARAGVEQWFGVASSADGTKLVAVVYGGQIHTSTDSGATWTARESARSWTSVASSTDGSKLVATVLAGQIHTSTDSGATWTAQGPSANWTTVASSADGSKLVAGAQSGQIHTSTDAGANWTARAGIRYWRSVASSADGSKLVAVPEGDVIFSSTDSGLSWTSRASSRNWRSVASSADGSKLAAASEGSPVHTSLSGRSTVGTAGALSGNRHDMLTLQYIGGGEFIPIDYSSTGVFHVE